MDGNDVDWFISLKMPTLSGKTESPFIKNGLAYFYADSNNQDFRISQKDINDPKSSMGMTVTQAIDATKSSDKFWLFYNDQQPGRTDSDGHRAHAKGVMAFDSTQGFWLIHSAPRFADPDKAYYYPPTGTKFGQSFFCMTFEADQLHEIGRQIHVAQLSITKFGFPDSFAQYQKLQRAVKLGKSLGTKSCSFNRTTALKTKGGQWLTSYEKHRNFGKDLYSNQLVVNTKKAFYVETWLNGPRDYAPTCKTDDFVTNNRRIAPGGVEWSSALDHSKWAVSAEPATVCIGDINRQASQAKRGGGTMCIENQKIWKFFRDSIKTPECCAKVQGDCEAMPSDSVATDE
ncbi:unnamed protein product [Bursaphelenchus xylophilus]|uniref:(pine wood nematode) hypothetical protein n=1 Tax=Bursaphelenchus xylophilus TaxID=6326 RepID=A0A1I7RQY5_BURXY|nr:unnamed protein product [Bursaphelenchus xylophilus]CAG9130749.1 unnamed protein product [Bursaphelenchus xylophilus]